MTQKGSRDGIRTTAAWVWGEGWEEVINVAWIKVSGPGYTSDEFMRRQSGIRDDVPRPVKKQRMDKGDHWSKNSVWLRRIWCQLGICQFYACRV